jgi:hypothetical protein
MIALSSRPFWPCDGRRVILGYLAAGLRYTTELSILTKQCLDRRIAAIETLRQETKAWEHERHAKQTGVDWHFTTEDARIRLKRLYPQYQG